jgi:hypothetical protein
MNHSIVSRQRRTPVLVVLIFAFGIGCLGLALYRNAEAVPANQPFANAVQQRMEMIDQLKRVNTLLKEQNALLEQQNELLRAALPKRAAEAAKER